MIISNLQTYNFIFFNEEVNFNVYFTSILFLISYIYLIVVIVNYVFINNTKAYKQNTNYKLNSSSLTNLNLLLILSVVVMVIAVKGYFSTLWYSHLVVDNFQIKTTLAVTGMFIVNYWIIKSNSLSINNYLNDFIISFLNINFWLTFLFLSNNLFTFIFFIEILSVSVMLLTSSSMFYSNLSLKKKSYTANLFFYLNLPYYQINSLLLLFWISFIASINLFFFTYYFLYYFITLDVFFFEYVFLFLKININTYNFVTYYFVWFNLMFCVLLKCGIVPFYMWKPNFFKGISYLNILVYTTHYYFIFFLYFVVFILTSYQNMLSSFVFVNLAILFISFLFMVSIMGSVTYIKSFFAVSSILNSFFILMVVIEINYEGIHSII